MRILIKRIDFEEPTILNGVTVITDDQQGEYYLFHGVNEESGHFSFAFPYATIEYFRKVGN